MANPRPKKSPYHHLIPEVKEQRRRRMWYGLLFCGVVIFAAIWHRYREYERQHGVGRTNIAPSAKERIVEAASGATP
jgi:hypothetical protein